MLFNNSIMRAVRHKCKKEIMVIYRKKNILIEIQKKCNESVKISKQAQRKEHRRFTYSFSFIKHIFVRYQYT